MAKSKSVTREEGKWAKYLLPIALVVLSLVTVPSLADPATLPRTLIWTAGALVWMIWKGAKAWKTGDFQLPRYPKWIIVSIGLLVIGHLVSLFVAHSLAEGILATSRMGVMLGSMYMLSWQLQEDGSEGKQNWIFAIWALGSIQALFAVGHFVMNFGGPASLPAGTQLNSNLMGVVMVLALPAAAYLALQVSAKPITKSLKLVAGITLPMLIGGVYLSASRTSLLIILMYTVLTVALCFSFLRKNEWLRKNRAIFISIVVLAVVGSTLLMMKGSQRKETPLKFEYLLNDEALIIPKTNSIGVRFALWNRSVQMAKRQPFTGVGAGNWKLEIPSYGIKGFDEKVRYGMHFFLRPHNDYLWIFSETGILGLLGYLGLLGGLFVYAARQILRAKTMAEVGIVIVALFGLSAYMVDAFFAFPGERVENTVLLAVFGAMILNADLKSRDKVARGAGQKGLLLLVLIPFVVQFGLALYKFPKDAANLRLRAAKAQKDWKEVGVQAGLADSWWTRYETHSATPFAWYAAVSNVEQARGLGGPGNPAFDQMMEEALAKTKLALEYSPHSLMALTELGSTYAQMNRFPEAVTAYEALLKTFPDNNEAWINLAICQYNLKDFDAAKAAISKVQAGFESSNLEALQNALK